MSLAEYRRKRDFSKTREPGPQIRARRGSNPSFVVQLHHARRRHYDFRLEVGGVLKSWAIPKGPSFDPSVKRLAVETEDHPLAYAAFEGDIPAGNYGAGHVKQFDAGTWSTAGDAAAQLRKGHLRFELHGEVLRGAWDLVRIAPQGERRNWLLVKQRDAFSGKYESDEYVDRDRRAAARSTGTGTASRAKPKNARASAADAELPIDASSLLALPGARRSAALTHAFAPQLATRVDAPPHGADWLHEVKWDGYRLLALRNGATVTLWSRNGLEWTQRLPETLAALRDLPAPDFALDGELVCVNGQRSDFSRLQDALSRGDTAALGYVLFDIVHCNGVDLRDVALHARKAVLRRLIRAVPALAYSEHTEGDGQGMFDAARELGLEGIVSKRVDSAYASRRTDDWRKCKVVHGDEFAVLGWTPPSGSRRHVGSLLLAAATPDGGWRYVGRVGSGFSDALLARLGKRLPSMEAAHAFAEVPRVRGARWIKPGLVAEVDYRDITREGILRQASLHGIREDKTMGDLKNAARDAPAARKTAPGSAQRASGAKATQRASARSTRTAKRAVAKKTAKITSTAKAARKAKRVTPAKAAKSASKATRATSKQSATTARKAKPASKATRVKAAKAAKTAGKARHATPAIAAQRVQRARKRADSAMEIDGVAITHPERVVYPEKGITKGQVAQYYARVAPWLLREAADRPLSVVRCPNGAARACFFQKHAEAGLGDAVRLADIAEQDGTHARYLCIDSTRGLLQLAQMSVLELHIWGARSSAPDACDRLVFDLDPGKGVAFARIAAAAREVRLALQHVGLASWLRTSGGKGLHVVVPLRPAARWSQAREFAAALARTLAQRSPRDYVAVAGEKNRNDRIFIDYLRNGRGATSIASYSVRARAAAGVAMPLEWSALARLASADAYDMAAALAWLERRRRDPWRDIDAAKQKLPVA